MGWIGWDHLYRLRDFTFPQVGEADHTLGQTWRFGVWVNGKFSWSDDESFSRKLAYVHNSLVTDVTLDDPNKLGVRLVINDAFHHRKPVWLKRMAVTNLRQEAADVRLFFHHNVAMGGTTNRNGVKYYPQRRALTANRTHYWIMASAMVEGGEVGFSDYSCGQKGFNGKEGTYKDAEDGELARGHVAQGSVDSVGGIRLHLEPGETKVAYYWLVFGEDFDSVNEVEETVRSHPDQLIQSTTKYWQYWLAKNTAALSRSDVCFSNSPANPAKKESHGNGLADLSQGLKDLYDRSLLVVRMLSSVSGAIMAAVDDDQLDFNRDGYDYCWPRDGAINAAAMDAAGFGEISRSFYAFIRRVRTKKGYLGHRYTPSGAPGSTWHPDVGVNGEIQLPIQEDETALAVLGAWHHYRAHRDTEYMYESADNLYSNFIVPAADFLCRYVDASGLPLPSWDLWEEKRGVHAWTVATVYAGLCAAARLAKPVDADRGEKRAEKYKEAAAKVKSAFEAKFYSESLGRFVSRLTETGEQASIIDASMHGIWYFGLLPVNDERVVRTMQAVRDALWVKTEVGGMARLEGDYYFRQSDKYPGNPWIICTMWELQWQIARAKTLADLAPVRELLEHWLLKRTNSAGLLAEQVHPDTGDALSVCPLGWSHAQVILAIVEYVAKFEQLGGVVATHE
jgi:GH15 family glucan-1,4-alpha-glucosidase